MNHEPPKRATTNQQRGDNVTTNAAKPESIINKRTARIGFIGLGLMGSRLTRRLHSSGWDVQAWNRSPDPAKSLARDGVAISTSLSKLVADSDVILSSLANDAAVRSVYFDDGVFSSVKPGDVILEMSTISPELSRLLHQEASARGVDLLDLAISGSTPAVEAGTITLLGGGDKSTFERCTPIYESIAKQWFLIGPGSSGILMKLVVNLLLGVDMQAIAEAVSLGEHLRIDRNVLLDVLSRTTVIPPAFGGKIKKIKNNDYSPEFPLRLMSKDMDLVMDAAKTSGADLPAARVAQSVLASNLSSNGDRDLSAITPFIAGRQMRT
jgi:3-hydroxyisobutyrate dehydrogenase